MGHTDILNVNKYKAINRFWSRMIYKFIIYFVLLVAIPFHLPGSLNVRSILNTIPQDEQESLKILFYELFNENNFSYTLFGDKAMSLTGYFITSIDCNGMPSEEDISFWNKWDVWKKYAHAFPTTKYLLIEEPREKNGTKQVYFINKKSFVKTVDKNIKIFKKELGRNIAGSTLLKRY